MKVVIETKPKSRCKNRDSLIREALDYGFKAQKVSDSQAQQLISERATDKKFVHAPISLIKGKDEHFINTDFQGRKLKRI